MSYAWNKLRLAVRCLTNTGSRRERLAAAMADHLAGLRPKDLPSAWRAEFASVIDHPYSGRPLGQHASAKRMVEVLDDQEVDAMIGSILRLYDAVTRYQPIHVTVEAPGSASVSLPSHHVPMKIPGKKNTVSHMVCQWQGCALATR